MEQLADGAKIWLFLADHYVLNLTTQSAFELWSASLFYVSDAQNECIYIMTPLNTRHGKMMSDHPKVSGTVSDQTTDLSQAKGLQFSGAVQELGGAEEAHAMALYQKFFPVAEDFKQPVWKISFNELKLTDYSIDFGANYEWSSALAQ